jgi:hypothetical protein
MPFIKGEGGRPKGAKNKESREIKEILDSVVDWEAIAKKMNEKALNGSEQAAKLLFEYRYGKPVTVEITGKDGKPIQHEYPSNLSEDVVARIEAWASATARSRASREPRNIKSA